MVDPSQTAILRSAQPCAGRYGLVRAALVCAFALISTAAHAQGQTQAVAWDMATSAGAESGQARATQTFIANLAARTEGQFSVAFHPANSLMKPPEIKDAVRRGVVPIGEFTLSLHANEAAIYALDSVPFLATSYESARRLYEAQRPFLEKRLAEEGLKLLYSAPYLAHGLCADRPVAAAGDFRGMRLRSYNHFTKKLALLAGAYPVAVDTGDIPAAMNSRRIDAFTASAAQVATRKAWVFAPYFHDFAIWVPRNAVVVNRAHFDALPAEVRKAMLDAAKFAEDRAWDAVAKDHADRRAYLASAGAAVVTPGAPFIEAFASIGRQMADDWVKSAGPDGEAILAAFRK
jgi:TRAP-type C4-dicarboxylate transport system substrate-binding protein